MVLLDSELDPQNNLREIRQMCKFDSGADGLIYKINGNLVAKFQKSTRFEKGIFKVSPIGHGLKKEFSIAKKLYGEEVSVPEPYGIFYFNEPLDESWSMFGSLIKYPAFIMQYIDVQSEINLSNQDYISKLVKIEREKVSKLGFRCSDAEGLENTLWSQKERRVYLIDFFRWE